MVGPSGGIIKRTNLHKMAAVELLNCRCPEKSSKIEEENTGLLKSGSYGIVLRMKHFKCNVLR